MSLCPICNVAFSDRERKIISCSGVCGNSFHLACAKLPSNIIETIEKSHGLHWVCPDCTLSCAYFDNSKIQEILKEINKKFEVMKTDFLNSASKKLSEVGAGRLKPTVSYSSIVKNKTKPAVIIKPKDDSKTSSETKFDILGKIDPLSQNVKVCRVRNIQEGGVLIECENNADFKKLAVEKLSGNYEIREVKGLNPRIRIVGMSEKLADEDIRSYMVRMNSDLFNADHYVKILKVEPTKKNKDVFQTVVEVDRTSYGKILKAGYLFIGYDHCIVYDAFEIRRCYQCNEFNHHSSKCTKQLSCPRCGLNHALKDCNEVNLKCSNCLSNNNKNSTTYNVDHAVWHAKCPVYANLCDKMRVDFISNE